MPIVVLRQNCIKGKKNVSMRDILTFEEW